VQRERRRRMPPPKRSDLAPSGAGAGRRNRTPRRTSSTRSLDGNVDVVVAAGPRTSGSRGSPRTFGSGGRSVTRASVRRRYLERGSSPLAAVGSGPVGISMRTPDAPVPQGVATSPTPRCGEAGRARAPGDHVPVGTADGQMQTAALRRGRRRTDDRTDRMLEARCRFAGNPESRRSIPLRRGATGPPGLRRDDREAP
jgi:hypothetical protein